MNQQPTVRLLLLPSCTSPKELQGFRRFLGLAGVRMSEVLVLVGDGSGDIQVIDLPRTGKSGFTLEAVRRYEGHEPSMPPRPPEPSEPRLGGYTSALGRQVDSMALTEEQQMIRMEDTLSEREMTLVRNIRSTTGKIPRVALIERDGELAGVEVTYWYRPRGGGEESRTLLRDRGRSKEYAIDALRDALRSATQDHVNEG